ncbi:hypothetical protein K491DRAFT_667084 [Lophiostoma macrostomum CBS 122681]|uniref:Nab2-like CCCH zinc finger domain-containing protein n=1 Tax=Lophiostoma macrostomum CBS 122681 TaxID=1314788 RepID=A0A6A6SU82_9PLEO|nr:hypothetical protein K491DRAFT_667084 [Lophiostoma macrostomum CBS 122681]
MAVDFSLGTPFAAELQGLVQPKLAEYGWTTGDPEDSTIFEYILLMLGNNKDEGQIASELSNDLLDLGPDNSETQQFAHWLFEQIDTMRRQYSGEAANDAYANSTDHQMDGNDVAAPAQDTEMEGAGEAASIPTGPKAMRNGSGSKPARGGRMLNQMNKQMGRQDDSALHRVRGGGRINSHSREPPKGPRNQNLDRGLAAMANGRGVGNVGMAPNQMNPMNINQMGAMNPMQMPPMGQNGVPGMLNAQQQLVLMQMYEQQAQVMSQLFGGQGITNPSFAQNNRHKNGRPLNERMSRGKQGSNASLPPSSKFTKKDGPDETMGEGGPSTENGDGSSAMEVEGGRLDPSSTICKFNTRCSKPDCPFVHQSPAAPEGTPVDMNDTCSYGVACMNKKCVGKHPSPAQRQQYQADKECAFFPNCRDMANCPYKHPSMPPCRNGADCTTPGCKFWHSTVMCKFNPCTNWNCAFKHVEGQKRATINKTWTAAKNGEDDKKEHVSERKFVDEGQEEELIIPGKSSDDIEITT